MNMEYTMVIDNDEVHVIELVGKIRATIKVPTSLCDNMDDVVKFGNALSSIIVETCLNDDRAMD